VTSAGVPVVALRPQEVTATQQLQVGSPQNATGTKRRIVAEMTERKAATVTEWTSVRGVPTGGLVGEVTAVDSA
jgi:hypothetical protein